MDGQRLALLLRERHWSQTEFARRVGMSQATISLICRGQRQPSLEVLEKMCEELGVASGELLDAAENGLEEGRSDAEAGLLLSRFRALSARERRAVLRLVEALSEA